MKKLLAISLMALCVSTVASAGEVPFPGKQDPPPCTVNCTAATTTTDPIPDIIIELVLTLITFR